MSYRREIPRDLFNEANLLKCYGRLWLCLEQVPSAVGADLIHLHPTGSFQIHQNPADGSITILNVQLHVRGARYHLYRPLNARDPWPLYAERYDDIPDAESLAVFDDAGNLSDEFRQGIGILATQG